MTMQVPTIQELTGMAWKIKVELLETEISELQNALEGWKVSATMRRAEADELSVTLAKLRELYVDREHDLAAAVMECNALRAAITEMAELYKRHEGKYGGTGVADELEYILAADI